MEIVYHIGVNCTDGDKLVRALYKNAKEMEPHGIAIPGPNSYRRLLRETIQNLGGTPPAPGTRASLLSSILGKTEANRLVMSNSAFIGVPARVFDESALYANVEMKLSTLSMLFEGDDIHLGIALRNPATFVPALWAQVRNRTFDHFMNGVDPRAISWVDLISRIRRVAPDARLSVWCNEDTPLIWGSVMRRLIGGPEGVPLKGEYDLLSTIMSQQGMARFESYLRTHPPQSEMQQGRVIAAFLDKYALTEEIEEEVDLPGWDAHLVDALTRAYEDEVAEIATMEGVEFIEP